MDRKLRNAFLLTVALVVCAHALIVSGQEFNTSGSPGVNAPKSISGNTPPHQPASVPRDSQAFRQQEVSTKGPEPVEVLPSWSGTTRVQTPLKRPQRGADSDPTASESKQGGGSAAGVVLTTLVVLLLFALGLARLFLKRSPYAVGGLPSEAIDVLGRRMLDPRNSVYVVKVGSRMLLLGSSSSGLSALAEVTDPIEVASLANICAASQRPVPDAVKWLGKLWVGRAPDPETRSFDDQLGERLFNEAQQGESVRVDSLTVDTAREQNRAG